MHLLKNEGLAHINHKGKEVPARSTGKHCKCRNSCFRDLDDIVQADVISKLNSIETKNDQDLYLQGCKGGYSNKDINKSKKRDKGSWEAETEHLANGFRLQEKKLRQSSSQKPISFLGDGCPGFGEQAFTRHRRGDDGKVMKLRSIDKVHLLSKGFQNLKFTGVMDNDIMTIKLLSTCVNWQKTISVWDRVNSFTGIKYPSMAEYIVAKEIETKIKALSESFRDSGFSSQILDDLANKACAMDLNYDNVQLEMKKLQQYNLSLVQPECPESSTTNKTPKKFELKEKNALEKIMYNKLDKRKEEEKVLKYRVT
uniref:Uncharacterized protein n=1 Tax=Timema cristinae TaxID=61476 RepID=A0A7R9DHP8_TIMCR|nr:unnamed protein product [Timema cristinae]